MRGLDTKRRNPNVSREEYGSCNICMKEAKLTWDHVPPKACYSITPAIQQTLFQNMSSRAGNARRFSETQNSVKFRTLCSSCNNSLLGKKYDPVLKRFVTSILQISHTDLELPTMITIKTQPLALARAICGHLLAAKGDLENTEYDKIMREFFLDTEQHKPRGMNISYWYYPYESIVLIRDIVMPLIRGRINGPIAGFSILKFFPVAFLITDADRYEGLPNLPMKNGMNTDDELDIPLNLARIPHERWPEMVEDGNFYVGGKTIESSVIAYKKR